MKKSVKPVPARHQPARDPDQSIGIKSVKAKAAKKASKSLKKPKKQVSKPTSNHIIINKKVNKKAKWFVVHTYSGHENKVAEMLKQRVETMSLTDKVFEILIPTQNKIKINKGVKKTIAEKVFPGYLLIKMILTDDVWLTVRTTSGITGFVGAGNKPTPVSKKEVKAILGFMSMDAPKYKTTFSVNEAVKIIEGPFSSFLGTISKIDDEKGKVTVLVSIFDRETPVELDFLQVSKI